MYNELVETTRDLNLSRLDETGTTSAKADISYSQIIVKKVLCHNQSYIEPFLNADSSWHTDDNCLEYSDLFVVLSENEPVCVASVRKVSEDTCELSNIAALKPRAVYKSKMLCFLFAHHKYKFSYLEVGTSIISKGNINFYKRHGFKEVHTIKNFIIEKYDEPKYEKVRRWADKVVFRKKL